jgi:hypothetical protein
MRYVFLILFSLIPAASGYAGIFSILDEQFIDDINDLPYSAGSPTISWQEQDHIGAWVDIVGFRDITRIDGIDYTISKPESLALVQYEAFADPPGIFDSLDKSVSVYQFGNNTIASLHVVLKYHKISCDKSGCWISGRFTEEKDFIDSELSPLIYPSLMNGSANITEYNNTINPHAAIGLNLPGNSNLSKVTFRYGSDSLTHYFRQGHVEQTEKGIYFLNLSVVDFWTANTESLQHFNEWVMIPNSSRPDYSKLSIEISNPYETRTINNYSFERITYPAASTFSNPILMVVGMISTLIVMSIKIIRRISL